MPAEWLDFADYDQNPISFEEWGEKVIAALTGPESDKKTHAIEGLRNLTRRIDGMWNDGGGAYAFAPQKNLSIAEDLCVIAY